MVILRLALMSVVCLVCVSSVEARGGRRMMYQPTYNPYYTVAAPAPAAPVAQPATTTVVAPTNAIVQASATETASAVTPANATSTAPAPKPVVVGSAQWKAEQSARMGSVAHIGGGFGGGSHEGNGFGATADQAIRNSCYWGQLTPIEIGVARGANGYYATIFYR